MPAYGPNFMLKSKERSLLKSTSCYSAGVNLMGDDSNFNFLLPDIYYVFAIFILSTLRGLSSIVYSAFARLLVLRNEVIFCSFLLGDTDNELFLLDRVWTGIQIYLMY